MLGDIAQMLGQQGAVPTCVTGRRRRVQRRNDPPPMLGLVMPRLATARRIRHPGQAVPGKPFAQKAADVVALYLQPPENAVVLSVDEKPHIQALERAQGWLKLPNSKVLTGFNHEYKRHGTTTLFAALEITTGLVKARTLPAPPAGRVSALHEPHRRPTSRSGNPRHLGQPEHP